MPRPGQSLRRFIDRRLKPGGLVYVSYNALPGWTGDLPFQHLVRALAANARGDSAARFDAAARLIDRLADSGAAALASSYIVRELRERPDDYRPGYLVHEFLHAGWRPLYVTETAPRHGPDRARAGRLGDPPRKFRSLDPRPARPRARRRDRRPRSAASWCAISVIDQRFRCDVFARDAAGLDEGEQRRRLFVAGLALVRPPAAITYRAPTPAGQLDYANPAARAVVGALAAGARSLGEIPPGAAAPQDLLANALALCAAGDVRPVETGRVPVEALNRALRRRFGGAQETPLIALPCGTALELDHQLLGLLGSDMGPAWRDFLALHGV